MIKMKKACTIGAVALAAMTGAAQAAELRLTFGQPESYAIYPDMMAFAERLTNDGVPTKVYTSGSLLKLGETTPGLRDGLADIGFVVIPYTPAEFSETLTVFNLSMLSTSGEPMALPGAAMNGASMEYILLNCPTCLEQMKAQNQVYLVGSSSGPYILGCNTPIRTADDLKGKRIRVGAGNFTRWAEYVGAVGVNMPGNETYDALGKGALDCTTIGMADLYGQRLLEVTNSIVFGAPGGVYPGLGLVDFNGDTWRGLSAEQRQMVMKHAVRASAETTIRYATEDLAGRKVAEDGGKHEIVDAGADIAALNAAFVEQDMANIEKEMAEKYGVADAAAKIATARALVEKWKGLTKDMGLNDVDALEKLYWDEIYSKLDLATYGVN